MKSPFLPNSNITEFGIDKINNSTEDFLGYYVRSTASINVEDDICNDNTSVKPSILAIAKYLLESPTPQIVISIHGYANKRSTAIARYQKIYNFATRICQPRTSVFLGYCWPAENPTGDDPDSNTGKSTSFKDKRGYALESLPTLLAGMLITTLILGIITALLIVGQPSAFATLIVFGLIAIFSVVGTLALLNRANARSLLPNLPIWVLLLGLLIGAATIFSPINLNGLLVILLIAFVSLFAINLALILLRLATYSRDSYRASNYGVLDLVELIRQLDQAIFETKLLELLATQYKSEDFLGEAEDFRHEWEAADTQKKLELWRSIPSKSEKKLLIEQEVISATKKIKLTFIGHSMGCFVVTNTIRILSDVFDTKSINKNPSSEIGRAFCLGRLILVAPDIPVEAIMPRRGNFLRSSLRRCEEAYLFSNEGDLALRLASTAANYFSFPAKTRFSGYRLGNLTVKHFDKPDDHRPRRLQEQDYGIVNLKEGEAAKPYYYLEVRASDREHKNLNDIRPVESIEQEKIASIETALTADLFTYFDCTDYTDYTDSQENRLRGVVSYALKKSALTIWDYVKLSRAYFFKRGTENINAHGGYFDGKFSQKAMYELAFLGFRGFLERLKPGCSPNEQLHELSRECREKQIQVVLSPWITQRLSKPCD